MTGASAEALLVCGVARSRRATVAPASAEAAQCGATRDAGLGEPNHCALLSWSGSHRSVDFRQFIAILNNFQGTFVIIDYCINELNDTGHTDVLKAIDKLRNDRYSLPHIEANDADPQPLQRRADPNSRAVSVRARRARQIRFVVSICAVVSPHLKCPSHGPAARAERETDTSGHHGASQQQARRRGSFGGRN